MDTLENTPPKETPEGYLFYQPDTGTPPATGLFLPLELVDNLIVEFNQKLVAKATKDDQDRLIDAAQISPQVDPDPRSRHLVYANESVSLLFQMTSTLSTENRLRNKEMANRLLNAGPYRTVAVPKVDTDLDDKSSLDTLASLHLSHPHFSEVIDFIRQHLALASRSTRALGLPPILLNGEPGVGKTHFAFELAKVLGVSSRRVALDTPVTAATLMGSDKRWANSQYGLLFELVCLGKHANPIVVLDEIDKADVRREWNPLAPLHSLLEPSTAAKVRDLSVDFEFDASLVTWIATSNDSRFLSPAIRSRFAEFTIHRPNAADAIASATNVIARTFSSFEIEGVAAPDRSLAVALAHLTPREIAQVLKQTVANAILKGKSTITLEDIPVGVLEKQLPTHLLPDVCTKH